VRPSDTLARMGGEEFAVLAPGITMASIGELAERCRHAISEHPIAVDGVSIPVTTSAGAACMPGHAQHADELLRVADRALYEAKANGRNVVHVGFSGSPQRSIPIPETGTVGWLEVLADRLDSEQARQEHSSPWSSWRRFCASAPASPSRCAGAACPQHGYTTSARSQPRCTSSPSRHR